MKRGNGEGTIPRDGNYRTAELSWTNDESFQRRRRRRAKQHDAIAAFERLKAEVRDGRVPTGDRGNGPRFPTVVARAPRNNRCSLHQWELPRRILNDDVA